MQKKSRAFFASVSAACLMVAIFAVPAGAQKPFLDRVRKMYSLDQTNGKCVLCHEVKPHEEPSRKNLNAYGKAIQADPSMKPLLDKDEKFPFSKEQLDVFEKVVRKIEPLDSDGDGASNKEELEIGTFPGDPKSVPDKKALAKYRKDHPGSAPEAPKK